MRVIGVVSLLILALVGCVRAEDRGVWLKNDRIEAFVVTEPMFRVLSIRKPGEASLMDGPMLAERGIRLAFMGPDQVKTSFDVGNQPATILEQKPMSMQLRLAPADGLQYEVEIALAPDAARLTLVYRLRNVGDAERTVGCWSVISYPCDGAIVIPFDQTPRSRRRIVMPWWTRFPQPGFAFGRDTLLADSTKPVASTAHKVGVITDAGWIAFAKNDRALVSSCDFDAKATYPEDGANVSLFQTVQPDGSRCETEQMGPVKALAPGATIEHRETVELLTMPQPAPLDDPDVLRTLLQTARTARPETGAAGKRSNADESPPGRLH